MKVSKKLSAVLGGLLAVTGLAHGAEAEVESTKVSPFTSVLPNFYSLVQVRHYSIVKAAGDEIEGNRVYVQPRLILGSTFMDGKLDASFYFRAQQETNTDQIKQVATLGWITYDAFSNDNFFITPFADLSLPFQGKALVANLGWMNGAQYKMDTGIGALSFLGEIDIYGGFSGRQSETAVLGLDEGDGEKLSLVGEKQDSAPTSAVPLTTGFIAGAKLADVGGLKGLKLSAYANYDRDYTAKIEKTIVDGEERVSQTGYLAKNSVYNKYTVGYSFGEGYSMTNDLYHYYGGFYATRAEGTRFVNRITLSKKL